MTVAMLVLAILNLVVLLAVFGRLGDILITVKELHVRLRAPQSESFEKWMREKGYE